MPIQHKPDGWYWGSKGPFKTRAKAQQVATAAYASGYKEQAMNSTVGEFVGILLHSATITHFMHLQTDSYAEHKALGHFYEDIVSATDALAEAIQGLYQQKITNYPSMFVNVDKTPVEYLKVLKDLVANNRADMPQESNIQNEIDTIATLIDSTLYKLTFLK